MILSPDQYPTLPKWPNAFVTGKSVTPDQAKNIIFRTDMSCTYPSSYGFGNDRNFEAMCVQLFGWDKLIEFEQQWFDKTPEQRTAWLADGPTRISPYDIECEWADLMEVVPTQYTDNNWLASCYVGGPHGWCNPDGKIHSDGHNYGKWPTVEEIVADWTALVIAFPYLDLVCTLFSGEQCEDHSVPVCSVVVKNGMVEVHAPNLTLHEYGPTFDYDNAIDIAMAANLRNFLHSYDHEHGWSQEWIDEYGAKSIQAMREVAPFLFV